MNRHILALCCLGHFASPLMAQSTTPLGVEFGGRIDDANAEITLNALAALTAQFKLATPDAGQVIALIGPGAVQDGKPAQPYLDIFEDSQAAFLETVPVRDNVCSLQTRKSETGNTIVLIAFDTSTAGAGKPVNCTLIGMARL